jgi:hypothetical protein
MLENAREKAKRILGEHKPLPLPKGAQKKMDVVLQRVRKH